MQASVRAYLAYWENVANAALAARAEAEGLDPPEPVRLTLMPPDRVPEPHMRAPAAPPPAAQFARTQPNARQRGS